MAPDDEAAERDPAHVTKASIRHADGPRYRIG